MSKKYCLCGHTAATHSKMGTGICWMYGCKCSGFILKVIKPQNILDKINRLHSNSS